MNFLYFLAIYPNCKDCKHYLPNPNRKDISMWRCNKFKKFVETCRESELCGVNGTHFEQVIRCNL